MTPTNDNRKPDPGERLIASTLADCAVIETELGEGLQGLLREIGLFPAARAEVAACVWPVLDIVRRLEGEVIDFVRSRQHAGDVIDALVARVGAFADESARLATTPAQRDLAAKVGEFVAGLDEAWRAPPDV